MGFFFNTVLELSFYLDQLSNHSRSPKKKMLLKQLSIALLQNQELTQSQPSSQTSQLDYLAHLAGQSIFF